MYRRSHPDWLDEKVASYAEYHGERRWQEIERYLNGGSGLSPERSDWLCRHEELIRPLVEAAKAEHVARYGEGWLKRALAHRAATPVIATRSRYEPRKIFSVNLFRGY